MIISELVTEAYQSALVMADLMERLHLEGDHPWKNE